MGLVYENFSLLVYIMQYIPQPGHCSSLPAPNFQPTVTLDMYYFKFTVIITTKNTLNY